MSEFEHRLSAKQKKFPGKPKETAICGECYEKFSAFDYAQPALALQHHKISGQCRGPRKA